ncbi:MAG: hypothetical protein NO516_05955 [Candidatus Methanomethylicia archaeon]|nr:hypothetical protein [Candidatus Methanomethylicia archaeon]
MSQILSTLNQEMPKSILNASVMDVDPDEAFRTSKVIERMLEELSLFKNRYDLEEKKTSVKASISSTLIEIEILLDDLMPERFKAYGNLDDQDKEYIIKKVTALRAMLNQIREILRGK